MRIVAFSPVTERRLLVSQVRQRVRGGKGGLQSCDREKTAGLSCQTEGEG